MANPAKKDIQAAFEAAMAAIRRVHRMPALEPVPVLSDPVMAVGGKYRWDLETGRPVDIRLNPSSDHLELTALLEIGHWLDHQAVGVAGSFASVTHPRLKEWREAVLNSRTVERLNDIRDAGALPWRLPDGRRLSIATRASADELIRFEEMFSRSYAQFVSQESGCRVLKGQIRLFSDPASPWSIVPQYWPEEEFEEIALLFRRVIVEAGWSK
ncbi:MAG: hypothetical protein HZB13_07955 [Acidobacteria bacterium]|nr:hypothetical protein [Acidobacteriota bacterium]